MDFNIFCKYVPCSCENLKFRHIPDNFQISGFRRKVTSFFGILPKIFCTFFGKMPINFHMNTAHIVCKLAYYCFLVVKVWVSCSLSTLCSTVCTVCFYLLCQKNQKKHIRLSNFFEKISVTLTNTTSMVHIKDGRYVVCLGTAKCLFNFQLAALGCTVAPEEHRVSSRSSELCNWMPFLVFSKACQAWKKQIIHFGQRRSSSCKIKPIRLKVLML